LATKNGTITEIDEHGHALSRQARMLLAAFPTSMRHISSNVA
jgi:hypothetical protein